MPFDRSSALRTSPVPRRPTPPPLSSRCPLSCAPRLSSITASTSGLALTVPMAASCSQSAARCIASPMSWNRGCSMPSIPAHTSPRAKPTRHCVCCPPRTSSQRYPAPHRPPLHCLALSLSRARALSFPLSPSPALSTCPLSLILWLACLLARSRSPSPSLWGARSAPALPRRSSVIL